MVEGTSVKGGCDRPGCLASLGASWIPIPSLGTVPVPTLGRAGKEGKVLYLLRLRYEIT